MTRTLSKAVGTRLCGVFRGFDLFLNTCFSNLGLSHHRVYRNIVHLHVGCTSLLPDKDAVQNMSIHVNIMETKVIN